MAASHWIPHQVRDDNWGFCRINIEDELEYIKAGDILHYVLKNLVSS
ncbi:hypothetical protein [Pseudovibrio japonicus]|nr:hypothetical protein [Pseudovibrio japonicus]